MHLENILRTRNAKKIILFAIISMFMLLGYYNNWLHSMINKLTTVQKEDISNVDVFDLSKPLLPKTEYDKIECRKSANILNVSFPSICIHGLHDYVSRDIWNYGVWEGNVVAKYISYLIKNPNMLAIDIGAQLGTYSLYAAASGSKVLAVEPFYDNIIRIHKSALSSNLQNQIVLVQNALSDKRNEVKKMSNDEVNIGAQRLAANEQSYNSTFEELRKLKNGKFYVRTALLDDLVPYIPSDKYKKPYKSAIMKIDIEGFESFIFQNASKFFDAVNIEVIFMEWGVINGYYYERKRTTDEMLKFLYNRGYTAYDAGSDVALNKTFFLWPWDIIWKNFKF